MKSKLFVTALIMIFLTGPFTLSTYANIVSSGDTLPMNINELGDLDISDIFPFVKK